MDKFNPFNFTGRLGRLQYFGFSVIMGLIIGVVVGVVMGGVDPNTGDVDSGGAVALLISVIAGLVASFSYGVRRLHDFDKSGWWYLLALVPFAGFVLPLILLFAPPSPGANRYGTR